MNVLTQGCGACRLDQPAHVLTMAFQPVVDLQAGRIDAYEALVRGVNGESAGQMLSGLTAETRYSFDQACRVKAITLGAEVGIDRQLNINFMPNAIYEPRACIRLTLETAAKAGFPLDRLTFEIVEDERVNDTQFMKAIISEYRRHGFKIALDDFSTGYSGLSLLAELQPDIIKIDRALVRGCDSHKTRLAIIAHLVSLGRDIGVKVVAEGTETIAEVDALRGIGIRFMQGFYFARPKLAGIARDADIPW